MLSDHTVKLASLNIRGANNDVKRNSLFRWMANNFYDICLLQETYCVESNAKLFQRGWSGDILHSFSNSCHSRGVCIILRKRFKYNLMSYHTDKYGRIILINISVNDKILTIINIYAPCTMSERMLFFDQVTEFINSYAASKENLLIAGDFNCALQKVDRTSGITDKSGLSVYNLMDYFASCDIWRSLHPNEISYTYIDPSFRQIHSRIDMILCSKTLKPYVASCSINQAPSPDHKSVDITITFRNNNRGNGYWKMNNTILQHKEYQENIVNIFNDVVTEYSDYIPVQLL